MKEAKAVIPRVVLDRALGALKESGGLPSASLSDVRCVDDARGADEAVTRVKLEMMVPEAQVEDVVRTLQRAAHTGNPGDGPVLAIPIEQTVRTRAGERGAEEARNRAASGLVLAGLAAGSLPPAAGPARHPPSTPRPGLPGWSRPCWPAPGVRRR